MRRLNLHSLWIIAAALFLVVASPARAETIAYDIDGDHFVGIQDLLLLTEDWLSPACLIPGCAINRILESGPRTMETIAGGVQVLASDIINQVSWQDAQAGAGGAVNDPRFTIDTFVGTGVRMLVVAKLEGADLDFDVDAWGEASRYVNPNRVQELVALWQSGTISRDELELRWLQLLVDALAVQPAPIPAPEPVPDTPIE